MDKIIGDSLFKCPLCNDRIHLATVINECLHRFCKSCITNYFERDNTCPVCQVNLIDPLQTLRSDLTYQRLLYKIFRRKEKIVSSSISCQPLLDKIACKSLVRTCSVCLEYWNISSELFPSDASIGLSKCYLECSTSTPLSSIEKFLRIKHSIPSTLKIEFFYQSFLLNTENECLIDICYSFDRIDKDSSLDIRFIVSPYGYKALLKRIRQSEIDLTPPMDSTLKMKICRSESSWFIRQSTLPDLINSCEKQIKPKRKSKPPRRRIHFIPPSPPSENSICDNIPLDLSLKYIFVNPVNQ